MFLWSTLINFAVMITVLWYFTKDLVTEVFASRSRQVHLAIEEAEKAFGEASRQEAQWLTKWNDREAAAKEIARDWDLLRARHEKNAKEQTEAEIAKLQLDAKRVVEGYHRSVVGQLYHDSVQSCLRSAFFYLQHANQSGKLDPDFLEVLIRGVQRVS